MRINISVAVQAAGIIPHTINTVRQEYHTAKGLRINIDCYLCLITGFHRCVCIKIYKSTCQVINGLDIACKTLADDRFRAVGRDVGYLPELFPLIDIRDVDFDRRDRYSLERI